MKLVVKAGTEYIEIEAEIDMDKVKNFFLHVKEKWDKNKIKKYKFCFYLADTDCVSEYAIVKTSLTEVWQKINDKELIAYATCYGIKRPSIARFFDKAQILGEIQESNGYDEIDKDNFDICIEI